MKKALTVVIFTLLVSTFLVSGLFLDRQHKFSAFGVTQHKPLMKYNTTFLPKLASNHKSGNRRVIPTSYKNEVIILTFHDVSSTDKTRYDISPEAFDSDIADLVKHGYHFISLQKAIDFSNGKGSVPSNALVITTDDGYAGMYTYVYPVLKKYKIPATFFLVAGVIEKSPNTLTWRQIREMERSGLVTFGGHTFNSHGQVQVDKTTLEPATIGHMFNPKTKQTETSVAFEKRMLKDSKDAQQLFQKEFGHTSPLMAYPYGAYNKELDKCLRAAGYNYFFTEIPGVVRPSHKATHFARLDIGVPNLTPTQLINEISQWSDIINPKGNLPSQYIIKWRNT